MIKRIVTIERENIEGMSYTQLRKHTHRPIEAHVTVVVDDEHIYIGQFRTDIVFVGRKHFAKSCTEFNCTYKIKQRKWYGNDPMSMNVGLLRSVLETLHIDWALNMIINDPVTSSFVRRKVILADILRGKIISEEGFYKAILKRVYRVKLPVKSIKQYVLHGGDVRAPLHDIMDFTTNPDIYIDIMVNSENHEVRRLLADSLLYAADEDKKINPKWSQKRLQEEHQQQIYRAEQYEIDSKDSRRIYDDDIVDALKRWGVYLIDSEKEAFAYGLSFSNCVHRCYWDKIKYYKYMAFVTTINDETVMVGLNMSKEGLSVNQIYKPYNASPSLPTKISITKFVNEHQIILLNAVGDHKLPEVEEVECAIPF